MKDSIIIGLLQNVAILLSFAMLYENIWIQKEDSKSIIAKIITGIIIGGIGVALMFTPWILVPGISFDTRSVMLSISGLFFGALPTFVAILVCGIARIFMGGDGIWMGLAVIISSGGIGLLWRKFRPFWKTNNYIYELLALGLIVHLVMSVCTLLLPSGKILITFKTIALPILLIYSPACMLLGLLMLKQSRNWQNRLMQIKLLESERRLSKIFDSGNIVSLMLNKEGIITFCNDYFLYITGYSFDEINGKNWFDLFIPSEMKDIIYQIFIKGIREDNILSNNENEIFTKSGNLIYISWYNITLKSDSEEVTGTASIGVNITDIKRYENNLKEKNLEIEKQNIEYKKLNEDLIIAKEKVEETARLKTAFLNNISHEIRTPFNGILGFLSIIKDNTLTENERDLYINIINKSSYRLMNTINDIVEISQIQARQLKLKLTEVNISDIVNEMIDNFETYFTDKGLGFLIYNELLKTNEVIGTDAAKLKTVISNLFLNAIKFTKTGSIEFRIIKDGDYLLFSLKDTGIGIAEKKLQLIFEIFMQADVSSTRQFEGAGLGLSIARAYVEMLGGKIWVESELGKGSTFYFTIPYNCVKLEKEGIPDIVPLVKEEKSIKSLKILIAEDDEASELFISLFVKSFGEDLLCVKSGADAVETLRCNPDINLILMDIKMMGMNGLEATRQIRQFNKDVIIIAQTAYTLPEDRENAIDAGCNDYITKPIQKEELLTMIKKYF